MDNSKVDYINPKMTLHVWSYPHSNIKTTIVNPKPDYSKTVNQGQDLTKTCKLILGRDKVTSSPGPSPSEKGD